MFKFLKRILIKDLLARGPVSRLVLAIYNLIRPMYNVVSHVLEQLNSGKITRAAIDYMTEVKAAIESAMALVERVAAFLEIELPVHKALGTIGKSTDALRTARKDAMKLLK